MRGLDRLIELRRSGMRPAVLTVWVPSIAGRHAFEGAVICEESDRPRQCDLRALKGLTVLVMGQRDDGFDEAMSWVWAATAAGADSVGVAFPIPRGEGGGLDGPVWVRANGADVVTEGDLA